MARTALRISLFLVLLFALAACGTKDPYAPIRDLTELTQDAGAYHHLSPDARLLSEAAQQEAWDAFLTAHFDPWVRSEPKNPAEKVFWGLSAFAGKELFGENTLPLDAGWLDRMRAASRVEDYPSLRRRAVARDQTPACGSCPRTGPPFTPLTSQARGFPLTTCRTPWSLRAPRCWATHASEDKAWILVESRFAYGWVRAEDIAWVDDAFASSYQSGNYLAVTRDDVPLVDQDGRYRFTTHVGALFPMVEARHDGNPAIGVPVRDALGNAVLHRATPPEGTMEPAPRSRRPRTISPAPPTPCSAVPTAGAACTRTGTARPWSWT